MSRPVQVPSSRVAFGTNLRLGSPDPTPAGRSHPATQRLGFSDSRPSPPPGVRTRGGRWGV